MYLSALIKTCIRLTWLYLSGFSVVPGIHIKVVFKNTIKMALVGKTKLVCDFGQGIASIQKKGDGFFYFLLPYVFTEAH